MGGAGGGPEPCRGGEIGGAFSTDFVGACFGAAHEWAHDLTRALASGQAMNKGALAYSYKDPTHDIWDGASLGHLPSALSQPIQQVPRPPAPPFMPLAEGPAAGRDWLTAFQPHCHSSRNYSGSYQQCSINVCTFWASCARCILLSHLSQAYVLLASKSMCFTCVPSTRTHQSHQVAYVGFKGGNKDENSLKGNAIGLQKNGGWPMAAPSRKLPPREGAASTA